MTSLQKIEQAIEALPQNELEKFADWFAEYQETAFDKTIEKTIGNNALADLANAALAAHKKGESKAL